MISKDKKYRTRCGYKVVILSIEKTHVVFAVNENSEWDIYTADLEGNFYTGVEGDNPFDLIEVSEEIIWIEVFKRGDITTTLTHKSKEDAERSIANDKESRHLDLIERTYEL